MPVYVCLRENTCVLVISITDFFSFLKIFFYWRIIVLQHCLGSCHTSTWIIHMVEFLSQSNFCGLANNLHPTSTLAVFWHGCTKLNNKFNKIIFKTRSDKKKKKFSFSHVLTKSNRQKFYQLHNRLSIQDRDLSWVRASGATLSYGRSSAQVLPWFRFPTFISYDNFEESSWVSGYHCVRTM